MGIENAKIVVPARSKGFLNRIRILLFMLRRRRPSAVTHITGDIYFSGLAARGPTVITVHDLEMLGRARGLKKLLLQKLWIDWPCRKADAITVVSNKSRDRLLETCPTLSRDKIHTIPNSISEAHKPDPKPFPTGSFNVLQVGVKPNKNVVRLIQSLSGISCTLTVVGKENRELREIAEQNGVELDFRVNLSAEEMLQAYKDCDLLAFASLEEGFGLPIIEAQSIGRPVLTSNISSMPEVAGRGAVLVDPYDVDSIRAGVTRISTDGALRQRLIRAGWENAARFDRRKIAEQYLAVYRSIHLAQR
ncbi:MAG: glycosyltransferase family 1 protein [Pseudomonadota bacterium]